MTVRDQGTTRARVLMFAEDVTLAHLGRIVTLAHALPADQYDVAVACSVRGSRYVTMAGLRHCPLDTIGPTYFADRLAKGLVVHTEPLLRRAIADDEALFAREKPDLVVGDFRVSLGISALCAKIPYLAIQNAHWCEQSLLPYPLPSHPAVNLVGLPLTRLVFPWTLALGLAAYLRPFNRLRRSRGLAPVPSLRAMYTEAHRTLYADLPTLAPVAQLPPGHRYIGPIVWEPPVALPEFWHALPTDRPLVFANVGSSGDRRMLPALVQAVAGLPIAVALATANQTALPSLPANVWAAPYLPGKALSERAAVLITNGGSATGYMALAAGRPMLAVPSNMDQYFFSNAMVAAGLGLLVRADRVKPTLFAAALEQLLATPKFHEEAAKVARAVAETNAPAAFVETVAELLSGAAAATAHRDVPEPVRRDALAETGTGTV